jgi:hypothetical protein
MENEFIPYEQALALKELGFDESCFAIWSGIDELNFSITDTIRLYSSAFSINGTQSSKFYINDFNSLRVAAPTFSQAFRWFREKHNIQGYIYSSTVRGNVEKTKQFTGYIWNINGIDIPFLSTDARDELHDTYEEAELACIIKLIEITKTK